MTGHYLMLPWQAGDAPTALAEVARALGDPSVAVGTLVGVLAQRLVRSPCPTCATERDLTELELRQVPAEHPLLQSPRTVESPGCAACAKTGVCGRSALFEVAPVTETVRRALAEGAAAALLRRRIREAGVRSLRWEALLRVAAQQLTVTEALRATPADEAGTV